jgi:hypothetical protein
MSAAPQVRTALTENLKELHLPAMRECFESAAQQAENLRSGCAMRAGMDVWGLSLNAPITHSRISVLRKGRAMDYCNHPVATSSR